MFSASFTGIRCGLFVLLCESFVLREKQPLALGECWSSVWACQASGCPLSLPACLCRAPASFLATCFSIRAAFGRRRNPRSQPTRASLWVPSSLLDLPCVLQSGRAYLLLYNDTKIMLVFPVISGFCLGNLAKFGCIFSTPLVLPVASFVLYLLSLLVIFWSCCLSFLSRSVCNFIFL